jgi:hypothetical protein
MESEEKQSMEETKPLENLKTEQEIKEIKDKIQDMLNLNEIEELIKKNEHTFEFEGITYRVTKPNFKQKQEAYKRRIEKFTELLQNDKYMLEKDLKETYLKRGIDIDALTKEIQNKMKQRDDLMIKLGELIKNKGNELELNNFKNEIEILNSEITFLSIRKTSYLEFSLETQVMVYTYSYLTYLLAEKKEGESFVRVWNTYSDFENDKENLVNKFSYYVTVMTGVEEL